MQTYNFTKTPVAIDRLTLEITNANLSSVLDSMSSHGSSLEIRFETALSSGDEATLSDLVTAHTGNPIPPSVTARQIRVALFLSLGLTEADILAALNTLSEPTKTVALIEWEYSNMFERSRPLVDAVGVMLGKTPEELDELWLYAGSL